MGYETTFYGDLEIFPALTPLDRDYLKNFHLTRHYKRDVSSDYGVEGEFYVEGPDERKGSNWLIDEIPGAYNEPPSTQPSLWCGWYPSDDGARLICESGKTKCPKEWLDWLIDKFFLPRGYIVEGTVSFQGEEYPDQGIIEVKDGEVNMYYSSEVGR